MEALIMAMLQGFRVLLMSAVLGFMLSACPVEAQGRLVPPTVAEDPAIPSREIQVAGITRKIHVQTYGNSTNPVLMVVPGSLSDIRAYMPFKAFTDRYYVVLWDLRGCGLSERVPANELAIDLMAEEIHQVKLLYSPYAPVTLVGHSWSASFAAIYCAKYPADTMQVVLLEPPGLKAEYMKNLHQILRLTSVGYCDMNWFQSSLAPKDHETLDFSMLAMIKAGVRDFFVDINNMPKWPLWRIGGLALLVWEKEIIGPDGAWNFDHTQGLDSYLNTVLLVGSSHSPIGYDFQRRYNAQAFHSVKMLRINHSGHRMITEQWEALEHGLRAYLAQYQ
jgi:pimeloyl-ACP methyl ester carboxylesterase